MRIHVGSTNPNKVGAVQDVLATYPMFTGAEIVGIEVISGVSEQPTSLAESVSGATNRAKAAFDGAYMGIGIEAGLLEIPGAGPMNVQVCAIFDGTSVHHGFSSAYGLPESVAALMRDEAKTMGDAVHEVFADEPTAHSSKEMGLIGILSGGRVTRRMLCREAVEMAMIHVHVKAGV
jgi:inosine/xanthosine triphosphatase